MGRQVAAAAGICTRHRAWRTAMMRLCRDELMLAARCGGAVAIHAAMISWGPFWRLASRVPMVAASIWVFWHLQGGDRCR
jgi:hypothetical protein